MPSRKRRFRRVADDVPTRWFAYIVAAGALAATAAFGGLNTAAPHVNELDVGEVHSNDEADLSVERVALVDELLSFSLGPPATPRLAVVVSVTNLTDEPLPISGIRDNVNAIIDGDTEPTSSANSIDTRETADIALPSDDVVDVQSTSTRGSSFLQPGIPTRVAVLWAPDAEAAEAIRSGAPVTVFINDLTYGAHNFVREGDSWGDPVPAARVVATAELGGPIDITELDGSGSL